VTPIADLLIVNANIHTVDPDRPMAQALAIKKDVIALVGSDEDVRRLAGSAARVIDAGGRLIVPGFNDAHVHLIAGAEELVGIDLRPARNEEDMAHRLERHVTTLSSGEWITGGYWDHEAWPGKGLPTRDSIDSVTQNHPVFVKRLDGHMALANTHAMRLASITDDVIAPAGGTVVRDPRGRLTGLFKDAAMDLVTRAIPTATSETMRCKRRDERPQAERRRDRHSVGVTPKCCLKTRSSSVACGYPSVAATSFIDSASSASSRSASFIRARRTTSR
jgi:predicted amidohydrolase YtcJ